MDPNPGFPPGLSRPKSTTSLTPPAPSLLPPTLPHPPCREILSPFPQRASTASWASSLAAGLFPTSFPVFPVPPQVPRGTQPLSGAVHPAGCLPSTPHPMSNNDAIVNLAVLPAPDPSDPWHLAHARVCAHANQACAACSVAFICCSCRSLRFTPGPAPVAPPTPLPRRSRSSSPALFRNCGNGSPPPGFDNANDGYDDNAYMNALAESDTCDNSSCPCGPDEPASYSLTVEQFDEGTEEVYERIFRACSACNRSCRKSFMGHRIKSRIFDNSSRELLAKQAPTVLDTTASSSHSDTTPPPANSTQALPGPYTTDASLSAHNDALGIIAGLRDALRTLAGRPSTPAAFTATIRVKHNALCTHPVDSCPVCSHGLVCCSCHTLFTPAVSRHLACAGCKHVASSCCTTALCCMCNKMWLPTDSIAPVSVPTRRFYGGAGSNSSPEPDIWTPSPRSSPDEIDDLTACANVPLPASRSESDVSRAPSHASSVDDHLNVAATPLPTPDFSALADDAVDGFIHPSFPDRAILDPTDKHHFLGRGDLAVASLKLYAGRIFSETSHWVTAGHFLVDIFQGVTLNGSRDDFRRFVILVGTQLGFGDLALSMSDCLDVNRKMADEYMRLRDAATTWKQKAKANSKDAKSGRKALDELFFFFFFF